MQFNRGPDIDHPRGGIDNLSFSQSKRAPLSPEQRAKAKELVKERLTRLQLDLKKADRAVESASEAAARIATELRTQYEQDQVQQTDVKRLEQARSRVERATQASARLVRQIRATERELNSLEGEESGEEKAEAEREEAGSQQPE